MNHRPVTVPLATAILAATLLACSSDNGAAKRASGENVSHVSSPVINGKNSDASQDAVVLLVHYDPSSAEVGSCTGTLLSPSLVLTARHCVADTDEGAACDVNGTPLAQGVVRGNHPASTLYVFTGVTRPDFARRDVSPAGVGQKIFDDGGKNLCNHDIALLALKEPIARAPISPIRLDSDAVKGEILTAIGWGVTATTRQPNTRQQRTGIEILELGPDDTGNMPIPANEFGVGESICAGDSGGPALAETGAIVGVVSRGGNATKPNPNDPASGCIGGENIYTKVAPFKDLILEALAFVNADPWYEGGADPRLAKPGASCTDGAECRSNHCLAANPTAPTVTTCAEDCSATACPDGYTCRAEGSVQVCRSAADVARASSKTTTGCAIGAGSTSSNGALGYGSCSLALGLAALGRVARRRRRG